MKKRRQAAGFTLIELMVVITILGLLAGIASIALMPQLAKAKVDTTKVSMRAVIEAIDLHRIRKGRIPESIQEMCDPENGTLQMKDEPVDGWGNRFVYTRIDKKNYELMSLGADGVEGGEGEDADITRDDLTKVEQKEE